jgi:predicted metal-dependent hydrolase
VTTQLKSGNLAAMNFLFRRKFPETAEALIDGEIVAVTVKVSERARSYRLSLPHAGDPVLTVPSYGRWQEAAAFLDRQVPWLAERLRTQDRPVAFVAGNVVPLRGVDHVIRATGRVRGQVEIGETASGNPALFVPGDPEHRPRRLTDWFRSEAQHDLNARVKVHARRLGVEVGTVRLRGQATRWGSCSASGNLNFNWRLVLAPSFVLDYVAAHEVSHIVRMDHSRAFWKTVERTLPDMERGRDWLKVNGRQLMIYGYEG